MTTPESPRESSREGSADPTKFKADLAQLRERRAEASSDASSAYYSEDAAERSGAESELRNIDRELVMLAKDGVQKGLVVEVQQPHPGLRGTERGTQLKVAEEAADAAGLGWLKENIADGTAERALREKGYEEVVTPDATQSYWLKPEPQQ